MSCDTKNPLIRDGVSQTQRLLPALQPEYIKVDERSVADLLCYAYQYAKKVQYYDSENTPDGDWQTFINNDISTIIALISKSKKDINQRKGCFNDLIKTIENASAEDGQVDGQLKGQFKALFHFAFKVADEINSWYNSSIKELKLQEILKQTISSSLKGQLKKIIACYNCAASPEKNFLAEINIQEKYTSYLYDGDFLSSTFHPVWVSDTLTPWGTYIKNIPSDCTFFGEDPEPLGQLKSATERLIPLIECFMNAQARVITQASGFLLETLRNYSSHESHMALFLAFLQLFKYPQEQLNEITQKHLDFYYKDVLQFSHNSEIPDTAHVIFELSKHVDTPYTIKKGTFLKAGKDATGVDVFYQVDTDVALNKAKIEQLKTVFKDTKDNGRIYSATVANSQDGKGGMFESEEPKWKTFGESQKLDVDNYRSEGKRTMQFAEIGFAIASPSLLLKEGVRTITIVLNIANGSNLPIDNEDLKFYLSGEKEWITVSSGSIIPATNSITITITLGTDVPPIVPYNAKELSGGFNTKFPILKVLLNNKPDRTYLYERFKDITINSVDLTVAVTEVKDLLLQNETGLLNSNKPFYPFTTTPTIGSKFYVGSKEIFQKGLNFLKLTLDWKDVPNKKLKEHYDGLMHISNNTAFKVKVEVLSESKWKPVSNQKNIFAPENAQLPYELEFNSNDFKNYSSKLIEVDLTEYTVNTQRGFLKLELENPSDAFGHRKYRDAYTKAIIRLAKDPVPVKDSMNTEGLINQKELDLAKMDFKGIDSLSSEVKIPKEPYTPQLNSIKVEYQSKESITLKSTEPFKEDESKFFHIYPFGIQEIRETTSARHLFPPFINEGELYIGINGLHPRQNVSILFQMAEGSADPEKENQEVSWSYLRNNEWASIDNAVVISDATNGLINSGIITFDVPNDATNDNTVLASGYHWLRASVVNETAAICDAIDVLAQAVKVSYVNNKNDPSFLSTVLPVNIISKLQKKDAAIKSISQPYTSEGGREKEQSNQFYTRVSERLRHKRRGIAIWDYEKLVLEEFPSIYKVKCINHSTYISAEPELEFAPGFVAVIVIPNLRNRNAVNPLEPRVSKSLLTEIKEYLSKHISLFAAEKLEVLNPLYEQIELKFKVMFNEGDWENNRRLLEKDIIRFLSPWAFKEGQEIVFGGKIHKSIILNYVEEREYVDFVTEFKMIHIAKDETNLPVPTVVDEAIPTTARSILVSNETHSIEEAKNCV